MLPLTRTILPGDATAAFHARVASSTVRDFGSDEERAA